MPKIEPKFELALRRTIFYSVLIVIYLFLGATILSLIRPPRYDKGSLDKLERIDVKRAELLNVLWAETLAKSENDWEELANQKMEAYEKALLSSASSLVEQRDFSFWGHFERSFAMITTIGPIDCRELSTFAKIFCFIYALLGVPLTLLYLEKCNQMASSLCSTGKTLVAATSLIFFGAIIYDIVEQGSDDTPFIDAMFSVFLQFSTIGEEDPRVRGFFTYTLCLFGLSLMSVTFIIIQQELCKVRAVIGCLVDSLQSNQQCR
ncbi:unnamed protein product, partial [Mesorhabditis belari]|uniref:Potassium channel domain-containing protein n=1 Tax=Mesorhabditis belari TaxID=2138241 RepID=A0AAF3F5V8_9BILA